MLPSVYRHRAVPTSWHQKLMAACLWAGSSSAASMRSGAALYELAGLEKTELIEISTLTRTRPVDWVIAHALSEELSPRDRTTISGIPVVTVPRLLLELGSVVTRDTLEGTLDDALRRRLTTLDELSEILERVGGRGRPGVASLRQLLERTGPPTESLLETKFLQLLRRHGLPEPVKQYGVLQDKKVLARIDFCYPGAMLAIEIYGHRFHYRRPHWDRDQRRRRLLEQLGWRFLIVTWEDVHYRPKELIQTITDMIGTSRADGRGAPTMQQSSR